MNASKKLLRIVAVSVMVFVIGSLFVVRQYLKDVVDQSELVTRYTKAAIEDFTEVKVGSGFEVRISQSRELSVELEKGAETIPFSFKGNKLILPSTSSSELIKVRIRMPKITGIEASGNANVWLANYTQDSLNVMVEDSVVFTSADNKIINMAVHTNGKAKVMIKDNPMD